MGETSIKRLAARHIVVCHADGHEFEFDASPANDVAVPSALFAERWKNKRLPIDANHCREVARAAAEQAFRDNGSLSRA